MKQTPVVERKRWRECTARWGTTLEFARWHGFSFVANLLGGQPVHVHPGYVLVREVGAGETEFLAVLPPRAFDLMFDVDTEETA